MARHDILLAESRHRLKNLLAVVRALVSQTKVTGHSAEAYREALLGRLDVLAHAQELELGDGASGVSLQSLVTRTLAAFVNQARIGPAPDVQLPHAQVLPMSLILHELATNAAKYGALSAADGAVEVGWDVTRASQERDGREPTLIFDWREAG